MCTRTFSSTRSELDYASLLRSLSDPLSLQEGPDVLQKHEEMKRVTRRLLEAELHVPLLRCLVLRMDEEHTSADLFRRIDTSEENVLEQRSTQSGALVVLVDGETSEKDRRHRPRSRLALARAGGRVLRGDLRCRECVVADYGLSIVERGDEDSRGVSGMCAAGVPFEPLVESRLAADEVVQVVLLPERLGAPVGHALFGCEDARLGKKLREPRVIPRGAVEQLDEAVPLVGLEHEPRPVGE